MKSNKISKSILIFTVLFISKIQAFAQIPVGYKTLKDTVSFIQKMNEHSKGIKTMESDFEQEKYLSVMSEKIVSKGHFCYKTSNRLRWEYLSPFQYLIVINNSKMQIKDNGKIKKYDMNSNKIFKGINEMMMSVIQGTLFNNKDYSVQYYENDKSFLLSLTPKQKTTREFLKTIQLFIGKSDYSVHKVSMIEPGGDYTHLNFSNRKTNEPITDDKFILK